MVGVRVWTSSLVLMVLLCAGCAEQEQSGPEATMDDPDVEGAPAGIDANGTVPHAVVAVLVNGTAVAPENGTFVVPAGVNVTFDASDSTNATAFRWTFTDANGAANVTEGPQATLMLPAGNHTMVLDAMLDNQTATQTLNITAVEFAAPELSLVGSSDIQFSKAAETWVAACKSATQALEFPAGTSTQRVQMTLSPTWTGAALNVQFSIYLLDADGNEVLKASRTGGNAALAMDESGLDLPAGAYTAKGEFCATGSNGFVPQGSFSVKGVAEHYG